MHKWMDFVVLWSNGVYSQTMPLWNNWCNSISTEWQGPVAVALCSLDTSVCVSCRKANTLLHSAEGLVLVVGLQDLPFSKGG